MGAAKVLLAALLVISIVTAVILNNLFQEPEKPEIKDKWWGPGSPVSEENEVPRPFTIKVDQLVLDDLNKRLKNTRFSRGLEGINFEYGTNHEYLQQFVQYWSSKYDWRKQEQRLNQLPQYLVKISGIDLHYVHVKPKNIKNKKVVPILISHGWPGSVVEFYNVIPKLVQPRDHLDFVFEVICPHIPGYGFSEAPHKPGHNFMETAHLYTKLMTKLGHDKFYAQGGDWGAIIVSTLAALYPERVIGLHLNMAAHDESPANLLRWVVGSVVPSLAPAAEVGSPGIYPISAFLSRMISGTGYFHLQATFPDSLGAALVDTPAGLASYILEKFAYATNLMSAASKPDGGLAILNKDELITNLMVYWVTKSITSSVRFYKEALAPEVRNLKVTRLKTEVPTGFLLCKREPLLGSTILGWSRYKNIVMWTKSDKCGHFAAMEFPGGFSDELWKFVAKLRKQ